MIEPNWKYCYPTTNAYKRLQMGKNVFLINNHLNKAKKDINVLFALSGCCGALRKTEKK